MNYINLVRQPHTGFKSFSTPGFRNVTETTTADILISSTSTTSSLLPAKRSSPDPPDEPSFVIAQVKRTKLNHLTEKENSFRTASKVASSSSSSSQRPPVRRAPDIIEVDDDDDIPQTVSIEDTMQEVSPVQHHFYIF